MIVVSNFSRIFKNVDSDTKRFSLALLMAILFNIVLLQLANEVWGLYWYGSLIPIYFSLVFAKLSDKLARLPVLFSTFLICLSTSISFHSMNTIYKKYHYEPYAPLFLKSYFTGELNKFLFQENSIHKILSNNAKIITTFKFFFTEEDVLVKKFSRKKITEVLYSRYTEQIKPLTHCLFPNELEYIAVELLKEKYTRQKWMKYRQGYFFDRLKDFDFSYTTQSLCEIPTIKDLDTIYSMHKTTKIKRKNSEFLTADIDGDKQEEIIWIDYSNGRTTQVWYEKDKEFFLWSQIEAPGSLGSFGMHDFNGDGKSDLFYLNFLENQVWVGLNFGQNILNFQIWLEKLEWQKPSVVFEDINQDGKTDIIFKDANTTKQYFSTGKKFVLERDEK